MKSPLIRPLIMGVFAFPLLVAGQRGALGGAGPVAVQGQAAIAALSGAGQMAGETGSGTPRYSDPGNNFFSNVPINELSPRAFRRFHHRFQAVAAGEYWFKSVAGYKVSFVEDRRSEFAYYDRQGSFQYSVRYYEGNEIPGEPGEIVKRRYPGYKIGVVTEVNDGAKIFYTVQIKNPLFIKVLAVEDGRITVVGELDNGGADFGVAEAAR